MFVGSLVAIVTPMRGDGAVDFQAWARLLEFHAASGTQGVVVGGTTGESATIKEEELASPRAALVSSCAGASR
jgi:4-hydroxy-tetrahydrodipicolinate synthase